MKKMINTLLILGVFLLASCEDKMDNSNSITFDEVTTSNVNDGPFYYNFVEKKQNETSYHLVYKNVDAGGGFSMPSFSLSNSVMLSIISGSNFESVRYEGYAPGGVAFIVDALTDNRNRTAGEVRAAFVKYGGTLGETNSVAFQFDRVGSIRVKTSEKDSDKMFELAIELGAEEVIDTEEYYEFITTQENFYNLRNSLETKISDDISAELIWKPKNLIKVDNETAEKVLKIFETLEESDDVQTVSSNFDISDETLNKLRG